LPFTGTPFTPSPVSAIGTEIWPLRPIDLHRRLRRRRRRSRFLPRLT